ncbi:hypothetical protein D3C73_1165240 [compost metagenome]
MLAGTVGITGDQAGDDQGADPRNRGDQPDAQADMAIEQAGNACRQVEDHAVHTHLDGEIRHAELQHPRVAQRTEEAVGAAVFFLRVFFIERGLQRVFFLAAEPTRVGRTVDQVEVRRDTDHRRHQAFNHE